MPHAMLTLHGLAVLYVYPVAWQERSRGLITAATQSLGISCT